MGFSLYVEDEIDEIISKLGYSINSLMAILAIKYINKNKGFIKQNIKLDEFHQIGFEAAIESSSENLDLSEFSKTFDLAEILKA